MNERDKVDPSAEGLRHKLIGLGERSIKKSYYPELKRRRLELERFRELLDSAGDAIFLVLAEDGTVVDANISACELVGLDHGQVLGGNLEDIFVRASAGNSPDCLADQPTMAGSAIRETTLPGPGGEEMAIELKLTRKTIAGTDYCVVIARDITRRKRVAQELEQLNQGLEQLVTNRTWELESAYRELKELESLKSMFLTTVSHDLRTPLTSVLGFVQVIHREVANHILPHVRYEADLARRTQRILDNLNVMREEGERLTRLVDDILDLSMIESGKMEWNDQPLLVPDVVKQAVDVVSGSLKAPVEFAVDLDPDLPQVRADRERVMQVLVNLLDNAVKYGGGRVTVRARALDPGFVEMDVADMGPGVPEREQDVIFERFRRARGDTLTGAETQGTGLGLPICKNIVEHYGGGIRVHGTQGQGATFTFSLPALPTRGSAGT